MSKWYSDSIEIVHEKYREIFRDNVSRYLDVMSENDVLEMRQWSMAELIDSKNTEKDRDALVSLMERHIRSR